MSFFVINPNKSTAHITDPSLAAKQKSVGGFIGLLPARNSKNIDVYVNEEGRLQGLRFNPLGTALANECGYPWGQELVGPVIFASAREQGEADLDDEQLAFLKRIVKELTEDED